jgi:hypothetical protein
VAGFCEHRDEPSGSIKKAGYSFDILSDNQLFKEYSAPWSKFSLAAPFWSCKIPGK